MVKKTPRVLFVSQESTLTGAPMQLLHLVRWLAREGWELTVATPESGPIVDLLRADGINVIVHPRLLKTEEHGKLREICAQNDVVVANTTVSWPAVRAAHEENKYAIWYLHETLLAAGWMQQSAEIRSMLELATLIVTPTQHNALIFRDVTRTPIEVVPYGIPASAVEAPKKSERPMAFITMATIEARKGQDILVQAIKLLPDEVKAAAVFRIVGRPHIPAFVEQVRASAAGISAIEFVGELDHTAAVELLAQSDTLICSSRDEAMPLAILEAMSLGKAVITTDIGGIAEWVRHEMNGLLVEPENPAALARAIERTFRDRRLVDEIRAGGRRTFERHFTVERFAHRFAHLLMNPPPPARVADVNIATGYTTWLQETSRVDHHALQKQLRQMRRQPVISVLLPVYNPDLELLEAAIESIRSQLYERWELCLADDASTDAIVRPFLEERARKDSRIRLTLRSHNGGIAACSNSALQLATGEWCALLDQDDVIAAEALACVALEIDEHSEAGIIYSDEDKIDRTGRRSDPFFKPDWNPELFLGQNFINHLGVYRTDLIRSVGGFREEVEGSQDYDLALRCVERLQPSQVRHIPRVLYHWRAVPGSLAAMVDAKPYAQEGARRAIADHLRRQEIVARVEACPEAGESHRVAYQLAEPVPLVSIIIPTRDRVELLERCLTSLREQTTYPSTELIIVDNGSTEARTLGFLRELEHKTGSLVLRDDGPFNFSRLLNQGVAASKGSVLAFLNNDLEAEEPGWLSEMVSHAVRDQTGAVGARLWYPNGTLQHGGVILGLGGMANHAFPGMPRGEEGYFRRAWLQQNCSAVTGACMVVRKELFVRVGGFDEVNLPVSFNDVDFCLRLTAAGFASVWTPYANLIHHESASRSHRRTEEEQALFRKEASYMRDTWGRELINDPYYNLNLSLELPGFELAYPPRAADAIRGR